MKKITMGDLKDRYDDIMSLINKACFLDPRFKALAFMTDSDKSFTIASVDEEAQELNDDDSTSLDTSTSTINLTDDDDAPPPSKKAKKGLMSLLDDVVNSKSQDEAAPLSDSERIKDRKGNEQLHYH